MNLNKQGPWLEAAARVLGCFLFFFSTGATASIATDLKHASATVSLMRVDICGKVVFYIGRLGSEERTRRPDEIMNSLEEWEFFERVRQALPIDPDLNAKPMTIWRLEVGDADILCAHYPRPKTP